MTIVHSQTTAEILRDLQFARPADRRLKRRLVSLYGARPWRMNDGQTELSGGAYFHWVFEERLEVDNNGVILTRIVWPVIDQAAGIVAGFATPDGDQLVEFYLDQGHDESDGRLGRMMIRPIIQMNPVRRATLEANEGSKRSALLHCLERKWQIANGILPHTLPALKDGARHRANCQDEFQLLIADHATIERAVNEAAPNRLFYWISPNQLFDLAVAGRCNVYMAIMNSYVLAGAASGRL